MEWIKRGNLKAITVVDTEHDQRQSGGKAENISSAALSVWICGQNLHYMWKCAYYSTSLNHFSKC